MNEPVEERSGSVTFRPRARLIRLLGEELISDEVMALVEIVKNSYDADAHRVDISLHNCTDCARGVISIRDDGHGMNLDTILHSWMEPATPHKHSRNGVKERTRLGRIQLGEKGVGRFAADKLGSELELLTRGEGAAEEIVVVIGWHHFDRDHYLDEVESRWLLQDPSEFTDGTHGTQLTIRQLRTPWTLEMATRLRDGLARLVSPSMRNMDFVVHLECPDFPVISGPVTNLLVETAPYRLSGSVDEEGIFTRDDSPTNNTDLRKLCQQQFVLPDGTLRSPECGPFSISLSVWDLEPLTGRGFGVDSALRRTIKASSGISIYRDGFRVWPYGEKDDDWLELNQRRVNNPTLRISNNQLIGFVEITHAGNPGLRDRTSREGLIDNDSFFDLKALVLATLSELETARFALRRQVPKINKDELAAEDDEVLRQLASVKDSVGRGPGGIKLALQEIERSYRAQLAEQRTRYDQVSRLAGVGMAAELLTDSFSREVLNAVTILRTLQGITNSDADSEVRDLVGHLASRLDRISEQLDIMGPLYRPDTTENDAIPIRAAIYDAVSLFAGRLDETRTQVTLVEQGNLLVRMNRAHLIQVLMILMENALQAMQVASTPDPRIHIEVFLEDSAAGLRLCDSGPGVPRNIESLIFQPYYSTRHAGRGLGLHVAMDILKSYNSRLQLLRSDALLGGACFEIRFDRRRIA